MSETMAMTAARPAAKKDCDCGCGGPHGECCELECLVHPRFFCGQLLADQDLTALVDWVKAKGALARYRHGLGVVCGLEVRCGKRGTITVSPGYAIDCCGRDVVVCTETPFDLGSCWQRPEDLCGNALAAPATKRESGTAAATDDRFGFIPEAELQAVDVFVRYSESQTDSRTALARGGCGGSGGCEYTRVHEGCEIYCRPAENKCEVDDDGWKKWTEGYASGAATLRDTLAGLSDFESMLRYVRRNPPTTFCFIHDWLCSLQQDEKNLASERLSEVAFWILQDWRNEYLRKPCRGCGPDTGIRLARVWIWMRRDSRGKENLTAVYVNSHAPFRRPLASDDWHVPPDQVNLGPYVWQPADAALQSLRRAGVLLTVQPISAPSLGVMQAQTEVIFTNYTTPATALTAYTTSDPYCTGQSRIVGFFATKVS